MGFESKFMTKLGFEKQCLTKASAFALSFHDVQYSSLDGIITTKEVLWQRLLFCFFVNKENLKVIKFE